MAERTPNHAMTIDVTGLQPVARDVAHKVATVFTRHLGADLISLVAHGSGVKGGIIGGSSDLDFGVIVSPSSVTTGGQLPLERVVGLHRDLARIDPAPFRYIQVYADAAGARHGVGFIPGTYHVVYGSQHVPLATADALVESARATLRALDPAAIRDQFSNALLDHGEGRLPRLVRGLCTVIWPTMFQVACLREPDPIHAWQWTKPEVVERLGDDSIVGPPLQRWWNLITQHYAAGEPVESALEALTAGVRFLEAAATWFRTSERGSDP